MSVPDLGAEELLTTTRAVRHRLDLDRPVAHTIGTGFLPAPRVPVDEVLHWERW